MAKANDLTGQKFGMLTVVRRAENEGRLVRWYCDCECGTKDCIVRGSDLKNKHIKSCGCKSKEEIDAEEKRKKASESRKNAKKLTEKEKKEWDDLYEYVRKDIMGYDSNQSLSRQMTLRLKGLLVNKYVENNSIKDSANYSYETILNTFKLCSQNIKNALRTNRFNDEMHKFNFILKIVEKNINDVHIRMKNVQKAKEEAKSKPIEVATHVGAEYKPKKKKKDRFSDLW